MQTCSRSDSKACSEPVVSVVAIKIVSSRRQKNMFGVLISKTSLPIISFESAAKFQQLGS